MLIVCTTSRLQLTTSTSAAVNHHLMYANCLCVCVCTRLQLTTSLTAAVNHHGSRPAASAGAASSLVTERTLSTSCPQWPAQTVPNGGTRLWSSSTGVRRAEARRDDDVITLRQQQQQPNGGDLGARRAGYDDVTGLWPATTGVRSL